MPYINQQYRELYDKGIKDIVLHLDLSGTQLKAELNYVISSIIVRLLENNMCYSNINDIIGALECSKLEIYRRVVAPYEDIKIKQNGDICKEINKCL